MPIGYAMTRRATRSIGVVRESSIFGSAASGPDGMRSQGTESREISMTRNALAQVGASIVIVGGLLIPAVGHAQSDYSPAKNNCTTRTGCANYATGDRTKTNPARNSRASRAQENRITAELNQQQLAGGGNSQQTTTPR
jgi:hypothetical protein